MARGHANSLFAKHPQLLKAETTEASNSSSGSSSSSSNSSGSSSGSSSDSTSTLVHSGVVRVEGLLSFLCVCFLCYVFVSVLCVTVLVVFVFAAKNLRNYRARSCVCVLCFSFSL